MLKSTSFIFDGVSSEAYNLMIYFLSDSETRELSLGTDVEVIEDRLPKRVTPIHYSVDMNKAMTFPLTFGSTEYLDDYDVDAILSWLTGHQQYKWLEFVDGDHYVRYKCHLNNMQSVYVNGLPIAFTCDVVCDSQFAYEYPQTFQYDVNTTETYIEFLNKSSYNGYLYPKLTLQMSDDCSSISILNESDNNREFKIEYFDRIAINTSAREHIYNSTIADEAASSKLAAAIGDEIIEDAEIEVDATDSESEAVTADIAEETETEASEIEGTEEEIVDDNKTYLSWHTTSMSISETESCNEIIKGEVTVGEDVVERWIALIQNSDKTYFSDDQGNTWSESLTPLPQAGNWTGCFGNSGFVVICTDAEQAVASYSLDGIEWTETILELPFSQTWKNVFFVETGANSFIKSAYIAIGNEDSSTVAISRTGWEWSSISLPISQEWRSVFSHNGKIFMLGGNSNVAICSTNCNDWDEIEFPITATWSDGCYGPSGYVVVANTLYGSGSRESVALRSDDGNIWEKIEFPIGNWTNIEYADGRYVAIGENQFAYSFNSKEWNNNALPLRVTGFTVAENKLLCSTGSNQYLISDPDSLIQGSFIIQIPTSEEFKVSDVYVSAFIDNTTSDVTYASNNIKLLATNVTEALDEESNILTEAEITGGQFIAVTTDLRNGSSDGVMMSAIYDEETNIVTVNYVADSSHDAVMTAPLQISIKYNALSITNLEYDGLVVNFDNANQIITTNKETLNMYEYFNKKFLRLVKGLNKLRIKTESGSCKVILNCEFLRKVGGR